MMLLLKWLCDDAAGDKAAKYVADVIMNAPSIP